MKNRPLSYAMFTSRADGTPRNFARVICSRCASVLEVNMHSMGNNPATVEKQARAEGWLFHAHTARKNVCPSCYLGQAPEPPAEAGGAKIEELAPVATTALAKALVEAVAAQKEKVMQVAPAYVAPKSPTPEQKMKIREELNGSYNEKMQCYIGPETDKDIAARLDVPWSWVRDLREIAYGPLKEDGAIVELKEELAKAKGYLAKLEERIHQLELQRRV